VVVRVWGSGASGMGWVPGVRGGLKGKPGSRGAEEGKESPAISPVKSGWLRGVEALREEGRGGG